MVAEIAKSRSKTLNVLMTGHGTIDSTLETIKRAASDYFVKSLNLDESMIHIWGEEFNRLDHWIRMGAKFWEEMDLQRM